MRKHWILRLAAVFIGFTLLAAACGNDDSPDGEGGAVEEPAGEEPAGEEPAGEEPAGEEPAGEEPVDLVQGGSVLAKVLDAGVLECGGNDTLPGFGIVDADGEFNGFDIDFCRVVAAAVLGDASAINVTPLVAAQRFPTLQSGEIDILIRNTTYTASRDGNEQANFLFTTFYDGQGFMVRADSTIQALPDVANASICVLTGTTTLLNLNAVLADRGIPFTPVEFESNDELNPAFVAGACEVWTSDASQLAAFAANMEVETRILPEIISKEPLGLVVADGDTQWAQVANWAGMATVQALEFGINSTNLASFTDSEDSSIRRFLGLPIADADGNEVVAEVGLGLPTDFAWNIIEQVGNYQEIFERNLAPIGLAMAGSPNALWTDGGQLYVPPFR